jgi:hypothetical protein
MRASCATALVGVLVRFDYVARYVLNAHNRSREVLESNR